MNGQRTDCIHLTCQREDVNVANALEENAHVLLYRSGNCTDKSSCLDRSTGTNMTF